MTVTTVQIYDFNVILSKGNNSKIGDDWDKKKIRITYFFMRNQNMKFQNISIHGSKLMLYTIHNKATTLNGPKLRRAITPTFHSIGSKFIQVNSSIPISIPNIMALA